MLIFTSLSKNVKKDSDGQSDDDMHRARHGRVPSIGAAILVGWNVSSS